MKVRSMKILAGVLVVAGGLWWAFSGEDAREDASLPGTGQDAGHGEIAEPVAAQGRVRERKNLLGQPADAFVAGLDAGGRDAPSWAWRSPPGKGKAGPRWTRPGPSRRARILYERARKDPYDPLKWIEYAKIEDLDGRHDMAAAALRRALQTGRSFEGVDEIRRLLEEYEEGVRKGLFPPVPGNAQMRRRTAGQPPPSRAPVE